MSTHLASGEGGLGESGGRVELQVQEPCRLGVVVCQVRARACLASLASQVPGEGVSPTTAYSPFTNIRCAGRAGWVGQVGQVGWAGLARSIPRVRE